MPKDRVLPRIAFHFESGVRLPHRKIIREILLLMSEKENRQFESLSYIFCSDEYLLDINKKFLSHDYYTDIITFNLAESGSESIVGEIYISVDRVRENARTHGSSFPDELLRVIFHGALHLCGYKDKKPAEIKAMRQAEDQYLQRFHEMFHVKHLKR